MSQSDAFLHTLHLESIRQIQLSEKNYDIHLINLWEHIGRINKNQAKAFRETATFNPLSWFGLIKLRIHQWAWAKFR